MESLATTEPWKISKGQSKTSSGSREGNWMMTASRQMYYPMDPRPSEVHISDIAASLSRQCRYGGHTSRHYSVAEHSVRMVWILRFAEFGKRVQCQALMHDATEAYVCDVPRPIKPSITNYREIEQLNWFAIADKFDLPLNLHPAVDELDMAIPTIEMKYIMPESHVSWPAPLWMPETMYFVGWPAWLARRLFMREFRILFSKNYED